MAGGLDPRSRAELARLKRDLPAAVARDALKELGQAAKDTADETRRRILAAAAPKYPDRGLRAEIAATVRAAGRVTARDAYVTVRSLGRLMPPGKTNLPAYADATGRDSTRRADFTRWRHPVFGDREVWVSQEWPSAHGWFYGAWNRDRFVRAAEQGMARAARNGGR